MHIEIYVPSQEQMEDITFHYWEVWQGIPELEYQKVECAAGEGLKYEKNGDYVWIPPTAVREYQQNSRTIYLVMKNKTRNGKIRAIWLEPETESLENIINLARDLNQREIDKTREKRMERNYQS